MWKSYNFSQFTHLYAPNIVSWGSSASPIVCEIVPKSRCSFLMSRISSGDSNCLTLACYFQGLPIKPTRPPRPQEKHMIIYSNFKRSQRLFGLCWSVMRLPTARRCRASWSMASLPSSRRSSRTGKTSTRAKASVARHPVSCCTVVFPRGLERYEPAWLYGIMVLS